MCLKNADSNEPENRRTGESAPVAVSPFRRFAPSPALGTPSITQRLTLLYVASTTALLLLAAGFLYWTLKRNLDHTRLALLGSKIEVLRLLLREPDKSAVLASEVEHEASENHPLRYYLRILDEQGQMLLETPGMKGLVAATLFPAPVEVTDEPLNRIEEMSLAGRSFLLVSVGPRPGPPARRRGHCKSRSIPPPAPLCWPTIAANS